jgi:hypothetical protein
LIIDLLPHHGYLKPFKILAADCFLWLFPWASGVNALGVVQTKGPGSAVIRVSALYDAHNNDEVSFDGPKLI